MTAEFAETPGQLDLLDLINDAPWSLYSVHADTVDGYYEAAAQWEAKYGRFALWPASHGWHAIDRGPRGGYGHCEPIVMAADLSCWFTYPEREDHTKGRCQCVGSFVHRTVCDHCGWHSAIYRGAEGAVAEGLNHAHPGWHLAPHVDPCRAIEQKAVDKWAAKVRDLYEAGQGERPPGWPVITRRDHPVSRSVPGRSPWGGYDVATATLYAALAGELQ